MDLLEQAPARIAVLTEGLTLEQLRAAPTPGEWSANGVLAHLRSCADVWGGCIATMLAEDNPTIRAMNPTTWILSTDYPDLQFSESLNAFSTQRADLMMTLRQLTPAGWERGATVTGAGKPLHPSVFSFANRLAIHERPHLKQIARTVDVVRNA